MTLLHRPAKAPQVSPGRGQKLCLSPAAKGRDGFSPVVQPFSLDQSVPKPAEKSEEQEANCIKSALKEGFPWRWGAGWVYFRLSGGSRSFPNEPVWSPSHDFCLSLLLSCVGFGSSLPAILSSHGRAAAPAWKYPWTTLSIPSQCQWDGSPCFVSVKGI